jgi:hypothetical protein
MRRASKPGAREPKATREGPRRYRKDARARSTTASADGVILRTYRIENRRKAANLRRNAGWSWHASTLAAHTSAVSKAVQSAPRPTLPPSATNFWLNSIGLVSLIVTFVLLRGSPLDTQTKLLITVAATAIPIGLCDIFFLRVHRRASTGLDWDKPFAPDLGRVATKVVGLAGTVGALAFVYWLLPEYHGAFYEPLVRLLRRFWAPLVAVSITYIWLVDGLLRDPLDTYWQLGRVLLFHPEDGQVKKDALANHARGWLVKGFFIPLMLVYLHGSVAKVTDAPLVNAQISTENLRLYDFLYDAGFAVDLMFTVIGYCLAFRVTDTHIRTAEPTMLGWAVALFCYQPFYSLMERQYVAYGGPGTAFGDLWRDYPVIKVAWAWAILACIAVYLLATVAFGWRFSNLTHRGILTGGPYRFTKHPAYISKNLSWWLSSVPFAFDGPWNERLRHALLLGCLNCIYFLRARTEERHLSRDPVYVQYALWMNENGLFAFLGRWVPFFQYKAPAQVTPIVAEPETAQREAA